MQNNMRKSDLLMNDVVTARRDLKAVQEQYSNAIGELAMLTKSDLVPTIKALEKGASVEEVKKNVAPVFEKMDSILYDLQDLQVKIDDIIHNMDGWDFADQAHLKILEILRAQETKQNEMRKDLLAIQEVLEAASDDDGDDKQDVLQALDDFLVNFSLLQDDVQEYIPQIEELFDEIDKTLRQSKKYSSTGLI